jgi:ADP-heptose:LPS heptosyltransferase
LGIAVLAPNKPFWGARIVQVPFLRALRERFPGTPVHLHSPVPAAADFVQWGLADSWSSYRTDGGRTRWLALAAEIRRSRPERVYNLRRWSARCCAVAALSPGWRAGFAGGFLGSRLDETVPYDSAIYLASRYVALADGRAPDGRDDRSVPLFRRWMEERAAPERPLPHALLMAGAAGAGKRWPLDRFLDLAGRIGRELPVTLLLGPDEAEERARLEPLLRRSEGNAVLPAGAAGNAVDLEVLIAPPLGELLARVLAAELVVANDCGPSHLAQLAGVRFLGLYREGRSTPPDWFADRENADLLRAGEDGWGALPAGIAAERALALLRAPARAERIVRFSRAT